MESVSDSDDDTPAPTKLAPPASVLVPTPHSAGRSLQGFLSQFKLEAGTHAGILAGLEQVGIQPVSINQITKAQLESMGASASDAQRIFDTATGPNPFPSAGPPKGAKPQGPKKGVLNKLGGVMKNWKTRFFQVVGDDLEYWECERATGKPIKKQGEIPLYQATVSAENVSGKQNTFGISTRVSKRLYVLQVRGSF